MTSYNYGNYAVSDTIGYYDYTNNPNKKPVTIVDTTNVKPKKDIAALLKELQTAQAQVAGNNSKEITMLPVMIDLNNMDEAKKARIMEYIEKLIKELKGQNVNKEEKTKAYAELEEKVSSMGIKYKDAVATIKEIENKYSMKFDDFFKDKPQFQKALIDFFKFNPENLQEPDKSRYYQAKAACIEIEQANKELANKAGCNTQYPEEETPTKPVAHNPWIKPLPWSTLPIHNNPDNIDPGFAIRAQNDGKDIDPGFSYKPKLEGLSPVFINAKPV